MAKLLPDLSFTGTIGNISAYRRRDSDKTILRTKGGPSKRKMRTSPRLAVQRKHSKEFSGRSAATKWIGQLLYFHRPLADYNIYGELNKLIKPIQGLDTESELGKRHILFSKNPKLLQGFSLNRKNSFDSIVRTPLNYSISKATITARIDIAELIPGINFFVPGKYPLFSFIASLGIVPDLHYNNDRGCYEPVGPCGIVYSCESEWFSVLGGSPATVLELNRELPVAPGNYTLMLTIGIRFGTLDPENKIMQVKWAGAAKVLGTE